MGEDHSLYPKGWWTVHEHCIIVALLVPILCAILCPILAAAMGYADLREWACHNCWGQTPWSQHHCWHCGRHWRARGWQHSPDRKGSWGDKGQRGKADKDKGKNKDKIPETANMCYIFEILTTYSFQI